VFQNVAHAAMAHAAKMDARLPAFRFIPVRSITRPSSEGYPSAPSLHEVFRAMYQ
jgi:hypothetical protein